MKKKIFVSAFSCMPHMGSEPGVGWHWIIEMSKYFELWVLVHKEPIDDIEEYARKKGIDAKIHFIYFDIPFNTLFFKNGKFRWVRLYYVLWTILANKIVKRVMIDNCVEIFHNLTFGNAIWPVSRYGQKKFFIWGPIGGVETIPAEFTRKYNWKSRCIEAVRRVIVKLLKFNIGFIRRCKNADLILCKTDDMLNAIPICYRGKVKLCTDVAVEYKDSCNFQLKAKKDNKIRLLSVGRLDGWRGFDLLIEAFANVIAIDSNFRLTILGDGLEKVNLLNLIHKKGLSDKIKLKGNVPIDKYNDYIQNCDVVVNACLKEGAVTVSFDSMRYGKPLVCIDSGGFTKYFEADYAIVLPRVHRQELISSLSDALLKMRDPTLRENMGRKAKGASNLFTWKQKGMIISNLINSALADSQMNTL